jgi:hypothetical protein
MGRLLIANHLDQSNNLVTQKHRPVNKLVFDCVYGLIGLLQGLLQRSLKAVYFFKVTLVFQWIWLLNLIQDFHAEGVSILSANWGALNINMDQFSHFHCSNLKLFKYSSIWITAFHIIHRNSHAIFWAFSSPDFLISFWWIWQEGKAWTR